MSRLASLGLSFALVISAGVAHAETTSEASASREAREAREARQSIDAAITQMRATSLRVRDQLRITRRKGSTQQITCVDQALSRSDAAIRRARELGDDALAAYGRDDIAGARAQMHRLGELRVAQSVAARDASVCMPGAAAPVITPQSGTTVKLEIDPRIPRVP